jgi:HAMP domain-containing protein
LVLLAIGIAMLMAGLFGAVIWYLAGRQLGRLADLSKAADAVSMGEELDNPVTSISQDEVGELAKSIDRLRGSMRSALKRLEA